jgi:hypothetical protein
MSIQRKIKDPSDVIVEKTAGEFAGVFYDSARSSGLTVIQLQGQKINLLRYKSPREFARSHLEKFIPAAVHALTEILSRPTTPESQKQIIYQALMERVNDPDIDMMAKTAKTLPEFEQTILYKPDTEKPKPVIVNTTKFEPKDLKHG